jgi:putative DNA primase/helicase
VAFNAGNLEAVATALRIKHPALKIIIAADDDHQTDGNPGLTKATAAAQAVSGLLAVPVFVAGRPDKATDFNDLHQLSGSDAVKLCIDAASLVGTDDDWPEPTPLPNALPSVDPFDAELLPQALRSWVMDIAYRMQCPPDFPAVAALVALSSLIGARAVIQPKAKDDWQVVPNLWGAVVGRPGVKKSPALSEALKPLHRLQQREFELWQAAHEAWQLDCKVAEMQEEGNQKKAKGIASKDPAGARALLAPVDAPAEPLARRYIVNDATVEKLGELMQQTPWGTLSYRDELYGLLTSLDKQGQEGSRAFYLQSYDGNQGYTFDRIGRGTVHIPRVCLAMIGGIQPGRLQEYVRGAVAGGSADDGLLQRFGLLVWPDTVGEFVHVDQWPDTPARQAAWAVFERLAEPQPANDTEPAVWRFDEAAQALFVEWLVPFEIEIRGDDLHPAMVSHLSKYRKLIPALALLFALIDTPDSGGVIHERELVRALSWGEFLRPHANRLYAAAVMPETTDAASLLAKIKGSKLVDRDGVILDSFTPRQIAVKGWAGLGTPDAVRKAADLLADFDHVRRDVLQSGATGGRPSDRYSINPRSAA